MSDDHGGPFLLSAILRSWHEKRHFRDHFQGK